MKSLSAPGMPLSTALLALICFLVIGATSAAVSVFGFSWLIIGIPALLLVLLIDGIVRPGANLLYPTLTHVPGKGSRVALSFDDGPDPATTPLILDALARHGARATFFTIGRHLQDHPSLAQRMVLEGHELGNHSWTHSRWRNFLSVRQQVHDIGRSATSISCLTGHPHQPLYRPPMGIKSPAVAQAAGQLGLTMVAWSLHSHDTRIADPQRIAERVLNLIRPGDIVLMHDGHDLSGRHRTVAAQALPQILEGLREKNLACVTITELLGAGASIPAA